ncbi:hypothetical protein X777_08310 [Ooceraea biroi]|uniref:Uncharacterized protein n=1 Tax=Ooceraea biroi TaxID=2015173 RepID=A0A026WZ71_OOCBI|nr:hypothetical protein X777_08310 [Ooceraea biroi]
MAAVVVSSSVSCSSSSFPPTRRVRFTRILLEDTRPVAYPASASRPHKHGGSNLNQLRLHESQQELQSVGFNTYNYSQFEEKYKPRQIFKYGDEYLEYGHRLGANERFARSKYPIDSTRLDQRYSRSHSQPERQHHLSQETRSKSQDSRELTFYQIDPPVKPENVRQHDGKSHQKTKKELTFYEIDSTPSSGQERKERHETCKERVDKSAKSHDKFHAVSQDRSQAAKHRQAQDQPKTANALPTSNYHQLNRSQSDLTECQLPNYHGHRNNPYIDPPKYRQFDRPPRYQEAPPKSDPPPKYYADPPKYAEVSRRQDDLKRIQEERGRRQAGGGGGGGGGGLSGCGGGGGGSNSGAGRGNTGTHGAETPSNLASITPTAREATRAVTTRQRLAHKTCDVLVTSNNNNNINNNSKENLLQETGDDCHLPLPPRCRVESLKSHHHHHHQHHQTRGISGSNGASGAAGNALVDFEVTACDKHKSTGSESSRGGDAVQGRPCERSMLKIEKLSGKAALHATGETVGKCGAERTKSSAQEIAGYGKHEVSKVTKSGHDVGHGYKVENLRYYGELKGYGGDYKAYGNVDKQPSASSGVLVSAHEKSHLLHVPMPCEKGDKCHGKGSSVASDRAQGYAGLAKTGQQQTEKSHHSGDHYYHRSSHSKPPSAYQMYQGAKYSYNGVPGTPAQASAAAAFFARSVLIQFSKSGIPS